MRGVRSFVPAHSVGVRPGRRPFLHSSAPQPGLENQVSNRAIQTNSPFPPAGERPGLVRVDVRVRPGFLRGQTTRGNASGGASAAVPRGRPVSLVYDPDDPILFVRRCAGLDSASSSGSGDGNHMRQRGSAAGGPSLTRQAFMMAAGAGGVLTAPTLLPSISMHGVRVNGLLFLGERD